MSEFAEFKCKALQQAYEAALANPQKLDCTKELAMMRTATVGIKLLMERAANNNGDLPSAENLGYLQSLSKEVIAATKTMAEVEQTFKVLITIDQLHQYTQKICDIITDECDAAQCERIIQKLLVLAVPTNDPSNADAPEPEVTKRYNRSEFQQILADWLDANDCTMVPHEVELRLRRDYVAKKVKELSADIEDTDIKEAYDEESLEMAGTGNGTQFQANSFLPRQSGRHK